MAGEGRGQPGDDGRVLGVVGEPPMTLGVMRPYRFEVPHRFDVDPGLLQELVEGELVARRARSCPRRRASARRCRPPARPAGPPVDRSSRSPWPSPGSAGSRGWRAIAGTAGRCVAVRPSLAVPVALVSAPDAAGVAALSGRHPAVQSGPVLLGPPGSAGSPYGGPASKSCGSVVG